MTENANALWPFLPLDMDCDTILHHYGSYIAADALETSALKVVCEALGG